MPEYSDYMAELTFECGGHFSCAALIYQHRENVVVEQHKVYVGVQVSVFLNFRENSDLGRQVTSSSAPPLSEPTLQR